MDEDEKRAEGEWTEHQRASWGMPGPMNRGCLGPSLWRGLLFAAFILLVLLLVDQLVS
ncbi:MAG: hypothetical protein ACYCX3_11730 [Thermoleophilia bacterium]